MVFYRKYILGGTEMGLFKDDDTLNLGDGTLEDFEDNSIDKDLLNQIFADDAENAGEETEDAHFDADSEGFYLDEDISAIDSSVTAEEAVPVETPAGEQEAGSAEKEETVAEEVPQKKEEIQEASVKEETPEEKQEPAVEETQQEEPAKSIISPVSGNDDFVNNEAMKAMNEERLNGTVTVITENTTITGSISSDGSLEVRGTITGDIECAGKVYINGKVSGGVVASEIYVNTPKLNGGLISEGTVRIGVGTVVLGDVTGTSAYIAGAVKGNIDIEGPLVIESTAVLKGDIKAQTITVKSGAIVDGYCSLYQTAVDMDKIFDE